LLARQLQWRSEKRTEETAKFWRIHHGFHCIQDNRNQAVALVTFDLQAIQMQGDEGHHCGYRTANLLKF
jgi:hypothetical protein